MKPYAITLTVVSMLAANFAFAAPVEIRAKSATEIREKMEKEIKSGKAIPKDVAQREQLSTELAAEASKVGSGKISTSSLSAAMKAKIQVNEGGQARSLDMLKITQSLINAKSANARLVVEGTDAAAKELVDVQRQLIETSLRFLSLAETTSGKQNDGMNAFGKQLSLLSETVTTMDAASAKSHMEIMNLAIELKLRNPEMNGDEAFVQAIKDHFGAKADQKLADLAGCQRGLVL